MQGLAPTQSSHRRNSSLEPTISSSLGTSPQPVKMLNGRVYGSRRASEAAERQKEYKERIEPKFVEWGFGKEGGGGIGSNSGKGLLGDAEEGSGMEWVKKRREERMKKREEEQKATFNSGDSSSSTSPTVLVTPNAVPTPLPPTPIIQVSEHQSPGTHLIASKTDPHHVTQAIQVPQRGPTGDRDVFDDNESESEEDDGDFSEDEEEEEDIRWVSMHGLG